jgi:hypothetical protein
MADFEDFLGGAAGGAATGAALGPWGALAGGVLGGVLGLGKKKPPQYTDPYKGIRDFGISQLLNSHQGADQAAVQAGWNQQLARDQEEQIRNNANFSGNANAISGISNKLQRESERGSQAAALQGNQIDQAARAQGLSMTMGASGMDQSNFALNQSYADRPSFLETLGQNALSTAAGLGASSLLPNQQPPSTDLNVPSNFSQNFTPPTFSAPSLTGATYPEFPKTMSAPSPMVFGGGEADSNPAQFSGLSSLAPQLDPAAERYDFDVLRNNYFSPSRYLAR